MPNSSLQNKCWRNEQIILFIAGSLLLVSGCLHTLIWVADGSSLGGPISWRKPILFGFSAGVTLISVGWMVGKMPRRRGDFLLIGTFGVAMFVEVGLITLQQWRGVASHFNQGTPFDAAVLAWIEGLILLATVIIAELTRRSFQRLRASPDMTLAIRGGMGLLFVSCLLGIVLVVYGNQRLSLGQSPELVGAAGVMKFPHGVPMHAIQFLPILAWFLIKVKADERQRFRAVACALGSTIVFTAFSLLQTFSGRARFELSWFSSIVLAGAVGLMLIPLYVGVTRMISARLQCSIGG